MTLQEFYEKEDKESWRGASSAFRNGVVCAVLDCHNSGYTKSKQFNRAWKRGHDAARQFISQGNVIDLDSSCEE